MKIYEGGCLLSGVQQNDEKKITTQQVCSVEVEE